MEVSIDSSTVLSTIAYLALAGMIIWMANRTTKTLTGHFERQPELPNLEQLGNLPRSGFVAVEKATYDVLKSAAKTFSDTPRRLEQVSNKVTATSQRLDDLVEHVLAISKLVEEAQERSSAELSALETNVQDALAFLVQQMPIQEDL